MVELVKKKLNKLIGLKKETFNELIKRKEIAVVRPRLIPTYRVGDEMAITSVLLSALRLIKEFRYEFLSNAKISKRGKMYVYTEVVFSEFPESRIDGLLIIVKSGVIRDAAILEVKNGNDKLDRNQLERYQQIARKLEIPTFITVSNEFVTEPSQSPVTLKQYKSISTYHFSWTYLLTIAHVLLYKNAANIEDEDQVETMKEVVRYFETDKSGVVGYSRMSSDWVQTVDNINKGGVLKVSDKEVVGAVRSWQQQERDMALALSRAIGFLVESGEAKYKGNLQQRVDDDRKALVSSRKLESNFKVRGAASDIKAHVIFDKRTIEMSVSLKVPGDKTAKGQIGWFKRQMELCWKRQPLLIEGMTKGLYLETCIKSARLNGRFPLSAFENMIESCYGKELREFRIIYVRDLGSRFSSARKFVELSECMLKDFYNGIVQHLVRWEPSAPKVTPKESNKEEEAFIEEVNRGEFEECANDESIRISRTNALF